MPVDRRDAPQRFQLIRKLAVLALMVASIGLPINQLFYYSLLAIAVIVLAVGRVTSRRRLWAIAVLIVFAAIVGKRVADVPRIEEGHNIFLPGGPENALVAGLPADVYRAMAAEFELISPPEKRCRPETQGCWQNSSRPRQVYAFSFDGIYDRPAYSRRVTDIDFSDASWQRLGFVNEVNYNWYSGTSDIVHGIRQRGLRGLFHPWRITMPHFVMHSLPVAFVGSQLCWRGDVIWEGPSERFTMLRHAETACRTIEPGDIGARIFGLAISPTSPLSMKLRPTTAVWLLQFVEPGLILIVFGALLFLLVRWNPRRLLLPFTLVGLSLVVIVANDATLAGGVRPFDRGNDGLAYDGWSRVMAQQLLAGDIVGALKGIEPVFYFTPGSRYLRVVEHLIFGETYFGYFSLLLLLPFLVYCLFRRFLPVRWALAVALIFVAFPIGGLFGSTFSLYVKYAAQGFGDPAASILFLAGLIALIGRSRQGPNARFVPALGAGFLFAIALFVRPNFALGAAVALGGAGLAVLWHGQLRRLVGMCIGFLPVFSMALHNWYYGGELVLFSQHTTFDFAMPMPPSAYFSALWELLRFDFSGGYLARGAFQIARMLTGPMELFVMVPVHAAAIVIVVCVMLRRHYDGWLRLLAAAALALHAPALFFIYSGRYHLLAWLITLLVCFVWVRNEALGWMNRRFPAFIHGIGEQPIIVWLSRRLDVFARASGLMPREREPANISAA